MLNAAFIILLYAVSNIRVVGSSGHEDRVKKKNAARVIFLSR
jgi:hypothetical protein